MRDVWVEPAAADWREALLTASIGAVLQPVALFLELEVLGRTPLIPIRIAHASVCAAVVIVLLLRRRATPAFSRAMFLTSFLPYLFVFWVAQATRTAAGETWWLFLGQKVAVLALATLATGPYWLSPLLIAALVAEAALQTALFEPARTPAEPWATAALGVVACVLYVSRMRRLAAQRKATHAQAVAEAQARWLETVFELHDLAHTPLQTLELNTLLLRTRHPETDVLARRMQRALARMRVLRKLLEQYESSTWPRTSSSAGP